MRIINHLTLLIIIIVVVVSCQENSEILERIGGESDSAEVVIDVNQDAGSTRTSLDGLLFTWIAGDDLGVYNSVSNNVAFTLDGNGGSSNGSFVGKLSYPTSDEMLCAIYPYNRNIVFEKGGKYTFTNGMSQIQNHNIDKTLNTASIGAYTYMYGKTLSAVVPSVNINVEMKHIMSILDFNLTGIPADTKIYSLTLKAKEPTFASTTSIDFSGVTPTITTGTSKASEIVVNINGESGIVVDGATLTIRLVMPPQTIKASVEVPKEWIVELKTSSSGETSSIDISSYTKRFDREVLYESGQRYKANLNFTRDFTLKESKPLVSAVFMDYATFGGVLTGQFEYSEMGIVSLATSSGEVNAAYGANTAYPWLTGVELLSDGDDSNKGVLKLTYIPHNQVDKRDYILTLNVGNSSKTVTIKYDNGYIPNSILAGSEFAMVTGENTIGVSDLNNRKSWAPRGFHFAKRGYIDNKIRGVNPFVDNDGVAITTTVDAALTWQHDNEASAGMDGVNTVDNTALITSFEYNRGRAQTLHLIDRHKKQGASLDSHNHAMAMYCHDTGAGWYNPSVSELRWIFDYARQYLGASYALNADWYWSASEYNNPYFSWYVHFRTGYTGGYKKDNNFYIRCIKDL